MNDPRKVVVLGAGGRDFHVFNVRFRDDPKVRVVAFTAAQIPHIDDRRYPPVLSGPLYPEGVPIVPESRLEELIAEHGVDEVVFAYSDVSLAEVERQEARVRAAGAAFRTFDPEATMISVEVPCIAVCAVRTGCGKSAVSRHVAAQLRELGLRVAVIRHPMPYGQLERQVVQRFAEIEDLERHECTIEEMEEYEPHLAVGGIVFAGADYRRVADAAAKEADVILWDGGNNDAPFVRPDLFITLLDPLRAGDELSYFPSRFNLEHADILIVAKSAQASAVQLRRVEASAREHNPGAVLIHGLSPIELTDEEAVRGKRALVVEDGPTTTHGGMPYGAGYLAAKRVGAEIVDPRPYACGEIAEAFERFPHLGKVLPALGYGAGEIAELEETIERVDCDVVVVGTPIDLARVVKITKPNVRAVYRYADAGAPELGEIVRERVVEMAAPA